MNWLERNGGGDGGPVGSSSLNDIPTKLQIGNQIAAQLLELFTNLFPRSVGTFTMAAAASRPQRLKRAGSDVPSRPGADRPMACILLPPLSSVMLSCPPNA